MARSRYQQASQGFLPIYGKSRGRRAFEVETGDANIRPVAQTVDTYVPVRNTPKSPLFEVAEALRSFESSLDGVLRKRQAEEDEQARIQGEAAELTHQADSYDEAARSGQIPYYANPNAKKSWEESRGRRITAELGTRLDTEVDEWIKQNPDAEWEDFSAFHSGKLAELYGNEKDPDRLRGMLPALRQQSIIGQQKWNKHREERAIQRGLGSVASDVSGAIDDATAVRVVDPKTGKEANYGEVTGRITTIVDHYTKQGLPLDAARETAANAVIAKAIENRDEGLLDAIPPGMVTSPKLQEKITKARETIDNRIYRDESREEKRRQRDQKAVEDKLWASTMELLAKDPDADIPESMVSHLPDGGRKFMVELHTLREAMRKEGSRVSDADQIAATMRIVEADDPVQQALKEAKAGNIKDPSKFNTALTQARQFAESKRRGDNSILRGPTLEAQQKALADRLQRRTTNEFGGEKLEKDPVAYAKYLHEYHSALVEWEQANPKATRLERMKAQREIGEEILKSIPELSVREAEAAKEQAARAKETAAKTAKDTQGAKEPQAAPTTGSAESDSAALDALRQSNPFLANASDERLRAILAKQRQGAQQPQQPQRPPGMMKLGGPTAEETAQAQQQQQQLPPGTMLASAPEGTPAPASPEDAVGNPFAVFQRPEVQQAIDLLPPEIRNLIKQQAAGPGAAVSPEGLPETTNPSRADPAVSPEGLPETVNPPVQPSQGQQVPTSGSPREQQRRFRARSRPVWTMRDETSQVEWVEERVPVSAPRTPRMQPTQGSGQRGAAVGGKAGGYDGTLGSMSRKYESGNKGVHMVSSGAGDPGGVSYGAHQLSTKDSMPAFLRSPEATHYASRFRGYKVGSPAFNRIYRQVAQEDPEGFAAAQHAFYTRTHFRPLESHAKAKGFDTNNKAVQEALYSMAIQHGGAAKIVNAAAAAAGKSQAEQVRALYAARRRYVAGLSTLPASTKRSVLNRYANEERDALALI